MLLGHSDLAATELYTHVRADLLEDVYRRCHPRNNGHVVPDPADSMPSLEELLRSPFGDAGEGGAQG